MGGFETALAAFGVAASTIVVLMFVLSLTIATAQNLVVRMAAVGVRAVKSWGGGILIAVGCLLIALAVWADFFARLIPR